MLGIAYTRQLNTIAAAFWGVLMLLLIYYAWIGRGAASREEV